MPRQTVSAMANEWRMALDQPAKQDESVSPKRLSGRLSKIFVGPRRAPVQYQTAGTLQGTHAKDAKGAKEKARTQEKLIPALSKQALTQLRLSSRRLGLLINFGKVHPKNGIERIVNGLTEGPSPGFGPQLLSCFASLAFFA